MTDNTNTNVSTDRRSFLRRTATVGALGATGLGLGVTAETASAQELQACSPSTDAPGSFPYVTEFGNTRGDFPRDADEIAIFINGWMSGRLTWPGEDQAYLTSRTASQNGYTHPVVGFSWRSTILWFNRAQRKAERMGGVLADWIESYKSNGDTTVHLLGHSLGSRVTVSCISNTDSVDTASILGGSIPASSVSMSGEWGSAIADSVDEFHNYYSENDGIVSSDDMVGHAGASGETPSNYTDHDVTNLVDNHCGYNRSGGCMPLVVENW
ncbi:MAG: alpha/beta hydrolase [Halobacteria archaeon]|nr:alpha/beta hydrolase [Halobacteria archaeon]